jgi:hypothetical protein
MNIHIRHALNGVDFIYSPRGSRKEAKLMPSHESKSALQLDHLTRVEEQFSEMRILLLPLAQDVAEEIASVAEGMLLEAVLQIHEDAGRGRGDRYGAVMNSRGRAFNGGDVRDCLDPIRTHLLSWMI